ncbi:MAG: hypothetical protein ACLGI3_01370, partial [Actinomycetes bacterium]
ATGNHRLRAIGVDGLIGTVAGGGSPAEGIGDGALAVDALLASPVGVAATPDGALLVVDAGHLRVRRIETDGRIRTVVGGAASDPNRDGWAATAARLSDPTGIAVSPEGKVFVAERAANRVRRAGLLMDGFAEGDQLIASEDGRRIFQFNGAGRHERTRDALTNATIHRFNYDAQGRLTSVTDPDSDRAEAPAAPLLSVVRNADGQPTELVSRGGRRTTLALDADGWLARFTNPAAEAVALTYQAGGLLRTLTDPRGSTYTFDYDAEGRLLKDTGPASSKTLERTELENGRRVTLTTSGGRTWVYRNERLPTGDARRTVTDPSGATTTTTRRTDGTIVVVEPDGTTRTVRAEPDPRFGMQA